MTDDHSTISRQPHLAKGDDVSTPRACSLPHRSNAHNASIPSALERYQTRVYRDYKTFLKGNNNMILIAETNGFFIYKYKEVLYAKKKRDGLSSAWSVIDNELSPNDNIDILLNRAEVFLLDDEILNALCYYDERSPSYTKPDQWDIDNGYTTPPRLRDCSCDNCFYGRDKLALEIIKLKKL